MSISESGDKGQNFNRVGIKAFVVMPFASKFNDILKYGIFKTCRKLGVQAERADEDFIGNQKAGTLGHIQEKIKKSDLIIAVLTDLNPNVLYELGYAKANNKLCIILVDKGQLSEIPFDFRNEFLLAYEDISDLSSSLEKNIIQLKSLNESYKDKSPYEYGEDSGDDSQRLLLNSSPKYKRDLVRRLTEDFYDEKERILSKSYSLNLGLDKNFLTRATPLFKNASKVYAVSIGCVSNFWTKDVKGAVDYLGNQPIETMRLFVFSSPEEANSYKKIMNAHHQHYGKTGGVFLCNHSAYKKFLDYVCKSKECSQYLSGRDFGILIHAYEDRPIPVEARLDDISLEFHESEKDQKTDPKLVGKFFDDLSETTFGEMNEKHGIYRWSPSFLSDHELWTKCLEDIFGQAAGAIYHILLFKKNINNLPTVLSSLKRKINALQIANRNWSVDFMWFGTTLSQQSHIDGYMFKILSNGEYSGALIVKFPTEVDLYNYYRDKEHATIREELYAEFDQKLLFLRQKRNIPLLQPRVSDFKDMMAFDEISEFIAQDYITRLDFIKLESISEIAAKDPVDFKI